MIRRSPCVALLLTGLLSAAAESQPLDTLALLAARLSSGNAVGAMEAFASNLTGYSGLSANVEAITAQADVLCSIDVITETTTGDRRTVDADWYMQLRSKAENGPTERRRQRVVITFENQKGRWRIVSFDPRSILDPPNI